MRRPLLGITAAVLALTACADDGSTGAPSSTKTDASPSPSTTSRGAYQEIEFTSRSRSSREGRVFGDGQVAIVLSHMGRSRDDQDDWASFAEELAGAGYRVLTYTHDNQEVWQDVLGAVDYLRDSGAEKVLAAGASLGAMASLYAAEQSGSDIDGVIWLAGVLHNSGYDFKETDVSQIACPMLIASGDQDGYGAGDDAVQLHSWAPTSELHVVPSMLHGTDILAEGGEPADQLEQAMLAFVARVAAGSGTC